MLARPKLLRLQQHPAPAGGFPPLSRGGGTPVRRERPAFGARTLDGLRGKPELLGLLALAGLLNLWSLSTNGNANTYYAAAVKSMAGSWHNFLFGSFDASGVMTVDKPPAALWVQALSVRVFGYSSWSLLVPQALMGVATVGLAYDLTRRRFGRAAGAAAGLVLALTPISVAISRHNNPDAMLVLCVVGAVWAMVRALEDGRTRWLMLCGALVGLAFETKMGAGLLVAPGLAVAWLWVAPNGRVAALRHGLAGAASAILVGGAWPLLVWLTPAADRPWISGTTDNSIWSLITQYNGLGRLDGQTGGPGGAAGRGGGAGGVFGGDTGPLRLLHASLGGQAGWMLGAGLAAGLTLAVLTRLKRSDPSTGWLLAVGGGFVVSYVAFSSAKGIFHPYYVSEIAPFTALLVGAGVGTVLKGGTAARIASPLLLAGGLITELIVVHDDATDLKRLIPLVVVVGALAAGALAAFDGTKLRRVALAVGIAALLAGPAIWSVETLGHATSSTFPAGGPASASSMGGPGGGGRGGFGGGTRGGASSSATRGSLPGAPGGSGTAAAGGNAASGTAAAGGTASAAGGTAASGTASGGGTPSAAGGTATSGTAAGGTAASTGSTRGGGGMFGGEDLTSSLSYIKAHGGGTLAVESQESAATAILQNGSAVVGIGGFSGRESTVSVTWLAQEVQSGKIRYVLATSSSQGMGNDSRQGSTTALTAAAKVGTTTSVSGLYDLSGKASALAALAS